MPEMKDSGIEWVGIIPAHWNVKMGKHSLRYLQKPVREDDDVITCFRDGEVTLRRNRREDGFTISMKEIGYQGIDIGDLIVHGMDGFAGAIGISDSRGKASPVLNVLDTDNNKRYIMYYLRNMAYNGVFIALSTGIRVRTCDTGWGKLRELPYIIPPRKEQDLIVKYIDQKCSEIDSLTADIQSQIDILEEYKKSVITEAVTKGLNHDVEMKDSGIEWIGDIPIEWDCWKLGHFSFVTKLAGFEFSDYFDYSAGGDVIAIRGLNLKNINIDISDVQAITEKVSDILPRSQIKINDVLVSYAGTVGNIGILQDSTRRYHLAPNVGKIEIIDDRLYAKYVAYFLTSSAGQEEIYQLKNKNAQESISMENIRRVKVLIPSLDEQEKIVNYLDDKCSEIDLAIVDKKAQLETLAEYKKSLIYEYVTGKKEVPADV